MDWYLTLKSNTFVEGSALCPVPLDIGGNKGGVLGALSLSKLCHVISYWFFFFFDIIVGTIVCDFFVIDYQLTDYE